MKTKLLEDVVPLAEDDKLMRRLPISREQAISGGVALSIGIEGPTHRIYRLIQTQTLIEAIEVFEILQSFGLKSSSGRREAGLPLTRVFHSER